MVAGAAVGLARSKLRSAETLCLVWVLAWCCGYFFWWGTANLLDFGLQESLGPVYHLPILAPIAILAGVSVDRATDSLKRRSRLPRSQLLGVGLALGSLAVGLSLNIEMVRTADRAGAVRSSEVAEYRAAGPGVVLAPPWWEGDPYVRYANGPDLDAALVVGLDSPDARLAITDAMWDRRTVAIVEERRLDGLFEDSTRRAMELISVAWQDLMIQVEWDSSRWRRAYVSTADSRAVELENGAWTQIGVPLLPNRSSRNTSESSPVRSEMVIIAYEDDRPRSGQDLAWPPKGESAISCTLPLEYSLARVKVVVPCVGRQHYAFPDGSEASAETDLSSVLRIAVRADR